jgi:L-aspartate semialdehyde sulfurtransferase ferredoxin
MARRRVVLTFPPKQVSKPMVYHLVKDFDLVTNIMRAEIEPPEIGRMLLELTGDKGAIEAGVRWLAEQGVEVADAARDIVLDFERCVSCGACTSVCLPDALTLDRETGELIFDKERCTFCRNCLNACPLSLFAIEF